MSEQENLREIVSFYYSFNGPQDIEFETFLKTNRRILKKIANYQYEDWSLAIEQEESLEEILCFLTVNYGRQYAAMTATSTKARLHLLQVWERKWGTLPTNWRIGFIRHKSFFEIQSIDLELLEYLFTQHRKFSSVIDHLIGLQNRTDESVILEDFIRTNESIGSLTLSESESESEIEFDEKTIIELSTDTAISIDWNIDDMDTDDILQVWVSEDSY